MFSAKSEIYELEEELAYKYSQCATPCTAEPITAQSLYQDIEKFVKECTKECAEIPQLMNYVD